LSGRDEMLGRVRRALADVQESDDRPVERAYARSLGLGPDEVLARLIDRLEDYGADVRRCARGEGAHVIAETLALQGARRIGIPHDLPASLRPPGVELVEGVDDLDGALTTCSVAIAETGTICLAGGIGDGRRALTLIPDLHVCVIPAERVVSTVPEGIAALADAAREGRPITLASGPSATSDIEMNRVAGVHGPRRLVVILVG
jgi:L-lactate dehydrogenase complex protein LldG